MEAKRAGYAVPSALLNGWINYQRNAARNPQIQGNYYDEMVLAYRLYTLALADSAELPAMNRLRETFKNNQQNQQDFRMPARWLLAMSYQHVGLKDAAQDVMGTIAKSVPSYQDSGYTYGSEMRDRGLLLAALVSLNANKETTWEVAEQVANELAANGGYISFGKYLLRMPQLESVFCAMPNDLFFLETDTDEQTIQEVYELAAQYKGLSVAQIQEIVNTNFRKVFG